MTPNSQNKFLCLQEEEVKRLLYSHTYIPQPLVARPAEENEKQGIKAETKAMGMIEKRSAIFIKVVKKSSFKKMKLRERCSCFFSLPIQARTSLADEKIKRALGRKTKPRTRKGCKTARSRVAPVSLDSRTLAKKEKMSCDGK